MKIGMYYVDKVGGDTIVSDFINKDKSSVNSINLNNNRIDVVGEFKGGEVKISAEYDGAAFEIERTENQPLGPSLYYFPQREMFINLKFKVDKYTMQIKEVPVEMTLEEIEKKLGHKVLLTSNSPKNDGKVK